SFAHHGEGAVLVGLEAVQRVGKEKDVHGESVMSGAGARQCCTNKAMMPATRPQKAELTPSRLMPDRVTRKVIKAGSRWRSSRKAVARPPPMVPSSANPATPMTSAGGNAASTPATAPPSKPMAM